jgi:hypothetical protein
MIFQKPADNLYLQQMCCETKIFIIHQTSASGIN